MKKIKINEIIKKKGKEPIVCLTSYTKNISEILDKYCDLILVGDSMSMVLYGMKHTREIKLDTMILHAKAVKKHTKKSPGVRFRGPRKGGKYPTPYSGQARL